MDIWASGGRGLAARAASRPSSTAARNCSNVKFSRDMYASLSCWSEGTCGACCSDWEAPWDAARRKASRGSGLWMPAEATWSWALKRRYASACWSPLAAAVMDAACTPGINSIFFISFFFPQLSRLLARYPSQSLGLGWQVQHLQSRKPVILVCRSDFAPARCISMRAYLLAAHMPGLIRVVNLIWKRNSLQTCRQAAICTSLC